MNPQLIRIIWISVNPGDDFYHYANGNWIKNNAVPEDRSSFGSFDIVDKRKEQTKVQDFA
ncbi:MAG: hypothetical protein IPF54_18560 [Draconibacterium sp.]|nr:hypothetical protein [Draconibacterium sp.]